MDENLKQQILAFLGKHLLTVIATIDISGDKPESAVIAFAELPNLNLIFGTSNQTRKYQNLQKNNRVSFVIGWDSKIGTVQYEGVARELSEQETGDYAKILATKNPASEKFVNREHQRYFIVTPTWIRLLDIANNINQEVTL